MSGEPRIIRRMICMCVFVRALFPFCAWVFVCACARACVRVCVSVRVLVCVFVCFRMRVSVYVCVYLYVCFCSYGFVLKHACPRKGFVCTLHFETRKHFQTGPLHTPCRAAVLRRRAPSPQIKPTNSGGK